MSEYALVPLALLTSTLAAVFGMGGGVPLITLMPGLVPAAAIIPLHAVTQLASNGSRALFGWRHIELSLLAPFLLGALGGAFAGALVFQQLDLSWLPALIGLFILVITWLPLPLVSGAGRWPLVLLGFYQTGIGMLIGASGPLGAALLSRRSSRRDWLVVNTAVYMSCNHLLKMLAFGLMGFAFSDYFLLLLGMVIGVVLGSWLGTWLRQFVPEINFQFWFRLLVTALALRMIVLGLFP
ncbi:MAG: sulfite exporter TauE/SafE family protein [Halieaceae bacterium]